jgi:uncharacterized protein (TIGR02284 family)
MTEMLEHPAVIGLLIGVTRKMIDSAIAFEVAANEARNYSYYAVLEQRAGERKLVATNLQHLLRSLGQRSPLRGTVMALVRRIIGRIVHRLFANEAIIIGLFNRAEAKSIASFDELLRHPDISEPTRMAIEREYTCVRDGYILFQELEAELMNSKLGSHW